MKLGDTARLTHAFSGQERDDFAALTGIRLDGETVPQPLVAGLISRLLGTQLPGPGTNYLKQELEWCAPAPIDSLIEVTVEIIRLRPEKALVDLATTCRIQNGPDICRGRALVLFADPKP